MADQRTTMRRAALLSLVLCLLFEVPAAASMSLTPHASSRKNFKWSRLKRFFRQTETAFSIDLLRQIENATRDEIKGRPNPIIAASEALQGGVDCDALSSNLHKNYVKTDLHLRPEWIHGARQVGDCPARYVVRELPSGSFPPAMLEASCVCDGSLCSSQGHRCVAVTHEVPVWVRKGRNYKKKEPVELTVGCVCAKRPAKDLESVAAAQKR